MCNKFQEPLTNLITTLKIFQMEQIQPKTGKIALKYGVILGLIGIVFNLMLYSQDLHYQIDLKRLLINLVIGLIFIIVGSILGLKEFKKKNGGFMSFGEGIKMGIGLALISSIIGMIFSYLLGEVIDPEMQEKAIEYGIGVMREKGMSEEVINQQVERQKNQSPVINIAFGLIISIFLGFIGALFPALVLKKSKPAY